MNMTWELVLTGSGLLAARELIPVAVKAIASRFEKPAAEKPTTTVNVHTPPAALPGPSAESAMGWADKTGPHPTISQMCTDHPVYARRCTVLETQREADRGETKTWIDQLKLAVKEEGENTRNAVRELSEKIGDGRVWQSAADVRIATLEREMGSVRRGAVK